MLSPELGAFHGGDFPSVIVGMVSSLSTFVIPPIKIAAEQLSKTLRRTVRSRASVESDDEATVVARSPSARVVEGEYRHPVGDVLSGKDEVELLPGLRWRQTNLFEGRDGVAISAAAFGYEVPKAQGAHPVKGSLRLQGLAFIPESRWVTVPIGVDR